MDRVTGSRVKVHLLLKGGEQGTPLKNEFRVTEPAPEAQKVKRGRLGKGGGEESKRCCLGNPGENPRAASFRSSDKMEEGRKERRRKRQTSLATL